MSQLYANEPTQTTHKDFMTSIVNPLGPIADRKIPMVIKKRKKKKEKRKKKKRKRKKKKNKKKKTKN